MPAHQIRKKPAAQLSRNALLNEEMDGLATCTIMEAYPKAAPFTPTIGGCPQSDTIRQILSDSHHWQYPPIFTSPPHKTTGCSILGNTTCYWKWNIQFHCLGGDPKGSRFAAQSRRYASIQAHLQSTSHTSDPFLMKAGDIR